MSPVHNLSDPVRDVVQLSSPSLPRHRAPARKIRVLLGCPGWPSGVLEIGSWAKREGLAEVVILQMQPGYGCRLDLDDRDYLAPGAVDAEIIDSFRRRGRRLSQESSLVRIDRQTWEIRDPTFQRTYRVVEAGQGLDVLLPAHLDHPRFAAAIRDYARRSGRGQELLDRDGNPSAAAREALLAMGGEFVLKLIEFAPHLVGFRVEGKFPEVRRFTAAVRLFCDCEVVLGGPTATSHPVDVLTDSGADYVFAGEAEETFGQFLQLAYHWNSKDRQPEIPGLAYRYAGRVCFNTLPSDGYEQTALDVKRLHGAQLRYARNARRPIASNEVLARNRLDWSLLEGFQTEFDSLFFTGGRGCPGECTFCALLHGQTVRTKSAQQILDEISAADAKVRDGTIKITQWDLFKYVDDPALKTKLSGWAAVYDEDFFLNRKRAIEFFRLWEQSPLKDRYRLSVQTNPLSLVRADGSPHEETFHWIDRLKPMIQLGAETFNPDLLARWHKRHDLRQLNTVLDALDRTRQDYTTFQLLTDQDTTPEELLESLRLLILNGFKRRRMRIASTAYTIPLYDTDARRLLEYRGFLGPERIRHFTDYESPQPSWMDPLVAELADMADAELQWTLIPEKRDGALRQAFEVVLERIGQERERVTGDPACSPSRRASIERLWEQGQATMEEIKEVQFAHPVAQHLGPSAAGKLTTPCATTC
jgi:radical SAM superfamily enzyme YgiQ (UPF0313 family)